MAGSWQGTPRRGGVEGDDVLPVTGGSPSGAREGWRGPWAWSSAEGGGLCCEPHLGAQSAGDGARGTCPEGASTAESHSMPAVAGRNHWQQLLMATGLTSRSCGAVGLWGLAMIFCQPAPRRRSSAPHAPAGPVLSRGSNPSRAEPPRREAGDKHSDRRCGNARPGREVPQHPPSLPGPSSPPPHPSDHALRQCSRRFCTLRAAGLAAA